MTTTLTKFSQSSKKSVFVQRKPNLINTKPKINKKLEFGNNKLSLKTKSKNYGISNLKSTNISKVEKNSKEIKNLAYSKIVKKFQKQINYKNLKFLRIFLTKQGKIRGRRTTKIEIRDHRLISKSIKRARCVGLIPFICDLLG